MKVCVLIPFYNHENGIASVVATLKPFGLRCLIVDDGSDARCAPVLDGIVQREGGWVQVIRYQPNQGKGMAVMTGFKAAFEQGFTHVLQIDADGQHDGDSIPKLLELARRHPRAVITGYGVYD